MKHDSTTWLSRESCVAGGVDWDEFCTYMMRDLEEKTNRRNERDLPLLVRWVI